VDYYRVLDNQEMSFLNQQLRELQKPETTLSDEMAAKMAWFEFPAPIGPNAGSDAVASLMCEVCGTANAADATVCTKCNAKLEKPPEPAPAGKEPAGEAPKSEKEVAKQNLISRIQKRFAEDERTPAVRSQTELVFAEVTFAPDAKPGRREIRVITKRGVSNALPFFVGQVPEVARKPMKTMQLPMLGKEYLAQRKRPPDEEELRVEVPCTMNGQIAAGEMNRYRFRRARGSVWSSPPKPGSWSPTSPTAFPGGSKPCSGCAMPAARKWRTTMISVPTRTRSSITRSPRMASIC
jgi:ribosomal protein L40E